MSRVVVMGIAGAGKSAVGRALADALGAPFLEGDDLHTTEAREGMAAGRALTDADRAPWLDAIGAWLCEHPDGVASCSALKRGYRDRLRALAPGLAFVHLDGDPAVARERVASRTGHFMPASLVESQLRDLQPLQADEAGVTLDYATPVPELVRRACAALR